ncbi:transporter substrate-binding domain-containing protein [Marinobacter mobilis]|uniref:Ligand-gated ion channel n=1 Tax=Marinobacter mobilis TaxID=488533 RepID=A0A1H2WP77_9GAMM|nr:transporter substrate-binding domain-containing protein [Marinobacter mobilis]SDW82401.1 Ligand-gated ion channel [Marinobacter mobilis]
MSALPRLIATLLFLIPGLLQAATPVRVGVTEVPPFVMQTDDGQWQGISMDLWSSISDELGLEYEVVALPFQQLLAQVESGQIDVAVGALTMTAERETRFDFSHPFYQTGLSIGVPNAPDQSVLTSLKSLLSWQFFSVVAALAGVLLLVGVILWLFERKHNPEQFGGSTAEGVGSGFWWAAVTMTTVGYGDKAPVSLLGRLVGLIWMFAGLIMVASFTAAITSALTVSNLQHQIQGPQDLPGNTVATIANTASEAYLSEQRIQYLSYPDLTTAMQSVVDGETDAIVYDRALMQYRNLQLPGQRLSILPGVFDNQLYGLALPQGSELRGPVSEQVLAVTESGDWSRIVSRYLGRDE